MMWKEQYLVWAGTVEGGYVGRPDAELVWANMAKPDSGFVRDEEGPLHAKIRFCIRVVDIVDNVSEFMASKSYVASSGQVKNPDTNELAAMRSRVMSGHESIAGMEQEDISAIAQHMLPERVGGRTGGSFAHEGVNPVDIKHSMIPYLQKAGGIHGACDSNVVSQDVDDDGDEVIPIEGDSTPAAKKRKKEKFFDADRVNAANVSNWQITMASMMNNALALNKHMDDLIILGAHQSDEILSIQISLMKSRQETLKLVFFNSSDTAEHDMKNHLAEVQDGKLKPPIQKYLNLITHADLRDCGRQLYSTCTCKADTVEASKSLAAFKDASQDLMNCCKGLVKDYTAMGKSLQKLKTKSSSTSAGPAVSTSFPGGGLGLPKTFWDTCADKSTEIPAKPYPLSAHDLSELNLRIPLILSRVSSVTELAKGPLSDRLNKLKTQFASHTLRASEGRAQKRLTDEDSSNVATALLKCIPADLRVTLSIDKHSSVPSLGPAIFSVVCGRDMYSTDMDLLPSLRAIVEGQRTCVCLPFNSMRDFIATHDKLTPEQITVTHATRFLKNLTPAQVGAMTDNGIKLWSGTVGPSDVMYLPAAFLIAEVVHNSTDLTGVRISLIAKTTEDIQTYEDAMKASQTAKDFDPKVLNLVITELKIALTPLDKSSGQKSLDNSQGKPLDAEV